MKTIKQIILIFLLVFSWNFSSSQNYKNFTIEDGLPSNHVYRVSQDGKGFMWFITDKGVVKFDGKTFKTFTTQNGMPLNDIWDIRITPNNKVWYFSKSTSLGYIENDSVYKFSSSVENEILSPNIIGQSGDSIFIQCNNSNYILKNNQFLKTRFKPKLGIDNMNKGINEFNKIIGDTRISYAEGNIIIDSIYFKDKLDHVIWKEGFKSDNEDRSLIQGQLNDSLFYNMSNKSITFFNFKSYKKHKLYFKNLLNKETVDIPRLHNVNGQIQLSGENFVAVMSSDYSLKTIYDLPLDLDSHFSFIDRFGNIWAASFSKGVFFLPEKQIKTKTHFKNDKVQEIELIDDRIYVSVYTKGLYESNSKTNNFDLIKANDAFTYQIKHIDSLNSNIFSTEYKVYTFKEGKFQARKNHYNYANKNVLGRTFEYYNGFLYASMHQGINKLDPQTFEFIDLYLKNGINNIVTFKDRLFLGSYSGLKELVDESIVDEIDGNMFGYPILDIGELNDSSLIIGTDGFGLYIFDGTNFQFIENTEKFSIEDIYVEHDSAFWIATQNGVYRLKDNDNQFIIDQSYFVSDGLLTNKVNSILLKDNVLYAGTDIGMSSFKINDTIEQENQLHSIYIDDIRINGVYSKTDSLSVKYKSNSNFQFNFGIIDFSNQKNLTTSYRLLPFHEQWSNINSNQLNLSNLSPDDYLLEIKVETPEKYQIVKQIPITIVPRYWQKLWFQILTSVLAAFLIFYLVYKLIKRGQKKHSQKLLFEKHLVEVQLKALRSQMNPHFVFNSLTAIQYLINNNDFESSETYLLKFSKLVRQFFEQAKENEILISDELNLLASYLEIEKLRFKDKLNYQFQIDEKINVKSAKIPNLLLQPVVENAVNHGIFNKIENGTIKIKFLYTEDESIKIEIIDDGVGIKNTNEKNKNRVKSTNILKDRVYFLNQSGDWKIEYKTEETTPGKKEPGNTSTFIIKKISK